MPKLNDQEVLAEIRRIEKEMGIGGLDGAKIITSAYSKLNIS